MKQKQIDMLLFAMRHPYDWHSCGHKEMQTMQSLAQLGLLEVANHSAHDQFRLAIPRPRLNDIGNPSRNTADTEIPIGTLKRDGLGRTGHA